MNFITYIDEICANFKINAHFQGKVNFGMFEGESWVFENGIINIEVVFVNMNGQLLVISPYRKPFIDKRFEKFYS